MTTENERAYTDVERRYNDHVYLNAEHHNAPKDGNDDPRFTEGERE